MALPARRSGLAPAQVEPVLRLIEREWPLLRGRIRPEAQGEEWVDAEGLKRLKRASLARLRRQVAPRRLRHRPFPELLQPQTGVTEQAAAWAEVLLDRYGIVSREAVRVEQPGPAGRPSAKPSGRWRR